MDFNYAPRYSELLKFTYPLSPHSWHSVIRLRTRLSRRPNNNICKPHIGRKLVRDTKWCVVVFFPQSYSRSQDIRTSWALYHLCHFKNYLNYLNCTAFVSWLKSILHKKDNAFYTISLQACLNINSYHISVTAYICVLLFSRQYSMDP